MRTAAIVLALDGGGAHAFAPAWARLVNRPICGWALAALAATPEIVDITLVTTHARHRQGDALIAATRHAHARTLSLDPLPARLPDLVHLARAAIGVACEYTLLHDGARPLLDPALITALLRRASRQRIAAAAVPIKETLKWADGSGRVRETPPRARLWQVTTPLLLHRDTLHALLARHSATIPDASEWDGLPRWVAQAGIAPVELVPAGHDDVVVRRRADLKTLAGLRPMHGSAVP